MISSIQQLKQTRASIAKLRSWLERQEEALGDSVLEWSEQLDDMDAVLSAAIEKEAGP